MLRTHRPVVGVSVKELLLRCDVWSVPRENNYRCWQITHTNQMSVLVFDDI
jgi:hypothetical protein